MTTNQAHSAAGHHADGWELFDLPATAVIDPEGKAAHLNGNITDNRIENLTWVMRCGDCGGTFGARSSR